MVFYNNIYIKIIVSFLIIFTVFILCAYLFFPIATLEVDFLDVGQGDAILIKTPAGQNILIDGGPDKTVLRRLGENLTWWDRKIDLIISTHPHDDHVSGLIEVLKKYQVGAALFRTINFNSPSFDSFLSLIREKEIKKVDFSDSHIMKLGDGCWFDLIYPFTDADVVLGEKDINDSSLIIKLDCLGKTFLFQGDAGIKAEENILKRDSGLDLDVDVYKVGHHGSDDQTCYRAQPQ